MTTEAKAKKFLVALDGSRFSEWAFHAAVDQLNPEADTLYLICVAQVDYISYT